MKIPRFVYYEISPGKLGIPVFVFHYVIPEEFESYLLYLKHNNYQTLTMEMFYEYITKNQQIPLKSVLLTFDDGKSNNWTVAYPLLKKYGIKATFFVIPSFMDHGVKCRSNLEDFWMQKISYQELMEEEKALPYLTWEEAKEMEKSGLIDIQSHTLNHQLCFVSAKIIDFQHPNSIGVPKYPWLWSAIEAPRGSDNWGAPVYKFKPRTVAKRYFDDVKLREICIDHVASCGGVKFFKRKNWSSELFNLVKMHQRTSPADGRYESDDEQRADIKYSLLESKKTIEKRLEKDCSFLALPWNQGNNLTLEISKEVGYKGVFYQTNLFKFPHYGSDPYRISRVEGFWIESLHGQERISILKKGVGRTKRQFYHLTKKLNLCGKTVD